MSAFLNAYYSVTRKPVDHWLGYSVAISGALMQMMSYGIDNSFSAFSNDMQNDASLGYPSATAVSFGNSVSLGLSPVFGVFAGFMVDRLPPRLMMLISTALLFAGLWISSTWAHSIIAVTFSYCLMTSISSACMLSPGAAATGSWFNKRIGLAQGINFCGGGVGSAVIPAVLGNWIEPYGWRKTFRLMSAFCAIGLFASIFSCRRGEPRDDEDDENKSDGDRSCEEMAYSELEDEDPRYKDSSKVAGAGAPRDEEAAEGDEPVAEQAASDASGNALNDDVKYQQSTEGGKGDFAAPDGGAHDVATERANAKAEKRLRRHAALMEAMHTRRLSPLEILRVMITIDFLANFFMFAIYGWAFYGLIYVTVPYVSSMGEAGTVYQYEVPISTSKASTAFTFWGVFQIFGSILIGGLASATTDAFAYTVCCGVGGVVSALLALCRTYAAFAACLSVIGFCTAGIFAVMPALIVKSFYGPNLGFFMACIFVAGCLGGFSAPPIQAQLQTRHEGNYTYGCIFISVCLTVPGLLCYFFLWPDKRNPVVECVEKATRKVVPKKIQENLQ